VNILSSNYGVSAKARSPFLSSKGVDYDRSHFDYIRNSHRGRQGAGHNVYNRTGDKLGSVDDIMIDKVSGRAIYA